MPSIEISDKLMDEINYVMNSHSCIKTPEDCIWYWLADLDGFIHGSL
jgi:hypothetical protein